MAFDFGKSFLNSITFAPKKLLGFGTSILGNIFGKFWWVLGIGVGVVVLLIILK